MWKKIHNIGINIIVSAILITIPLACRVNNEITEGTRSVSETGFPLSSTASFIPTRTVTPTVTPTEIPLPIQIRDIIMRNVVLDSTFIGLPSGTYLLYDLGSTLNYMSVDGLRFGDVFDMSNFQLPLQEPKALRNISGQPFLFITDHNYLNDDFSLSRINLVNGEMVTWDFVLSSGVTCDTVGTLVSPDGRWLAADCLWQGEHYIYVVDLQSGSAEVIAPQGYRCRISNNTRYEWDIRWTPNNQIQAICNTGSYLWEVTDCVIDPASESFQCQRGIFDEILAWSPDGSMIVLRRELAAPPNYQYFLADSSCLINQSSCENLQEFCDLPDHAMCGGYVWDISGRYFAWSDIRRSNLEQFYSNIYLLDLQNGSVETILVGQSGSWYLVGFSPDSQWLVFNAGEVTLLSLDYYLVRRTPMWGPFVGWLVVP
ncbi:MAG: hypothetical protein ABIJ39_07140 [Chloroflexota bacterium]